MTSTEDRLTHMLWLSMMEDIVKYLLVNTEGLLNGSEKADHHRSLCNTYLASVLLVMPRDIHRDFDSMDMFDFVHTKTQDLTSFLDDEIGFPLYDRNIPDYAEYTVLFFNKFIKYADDGMKQYYEWKEIR